MNQPGRPANSDLMNTAAEIITAVAALLTALPPVAAMLSSYTQHTTDPARQRTCPGGTNRRQRASASSTDPASS